MTKLKQTWAKLQQNWKTPLPGEYTTLKEFFSYCFGVMGICGFTFLCGETVNFASGYFCGAIMQIKLMDFTIISIIGLIVKYATLYIESISMTIFENMGNLQKNKVKRAFLAYVLCAVIGAAFYFIPSKPFEFIIKGLPGIVGNTLVIMGVGGLVNWFLRKKLCPKYGKYKPFMVIYGVPITLLTVAMTFVPVTMEYSWKIVLLHFLVTLRTRFTACYSDTPTSIVALITPNMVERQKYYSLGAIFLGLFRSIFRIIFPILIVFTGGYFDIRSYRLFVPIFAVVSLLMGLLFVGVKERVTEESKKDAPKVEFKKSAKELLKNKFFWLIEIGKPFETWMSLGDNIINLILIYQMRATWLTGVISLFGITSVLGNLITPVLVKRFEKRTCILFMRAVWLAITASYFVALKYQSIPIFIILLALRSILSAACNNITNNMSSDVLVYHQWKTGERADNMRNIFGWFTTPIGTALGLVSPWLLAKLGYTSDWDVLFDPNLFYPIMKVYIALSVISIAISTIPYFFYNMKKADHDRYVAEIAERARAEKEPPEPDDPVSPEPAPAEVVG
ncbi:MAG: MFS transporter [Clostridia bacterium]|nr:MFS transporter [Clostridia bacterium]